MLFQGVNILIILERKSLMNDMIDKLSKKMSTKDIKTETLENKIAEEIVMNKPSKSK